MAERTFILNFATSYPEHHTVLEREMDKVLKNPVRKKNVEKVKRFISVHVTKPNRKGSAAAKSAGKK